MNLACSDAQEHIWKYTHWDCRPHELTIYGAQSFFSSGGKINVLFRI